MYRKGVSALIKNKNNQFLLVNLQSFNKKYYAVLGGGVEPNESLKNAVYREIYEEVGIKKQQLKLVGKSTKPLYFNFKEIIINKGGNTYKGSKRYFFGFLFLGNKTHIKINKNEVRQCRWVKFSNLQKYLLFKDQYKDTVYYINKIF